MIFGGAAIEIRVFVISPEGDKSDNACYQIPADIADEKITGNTTLETPSQPAVLRGGGGGRAGIH